MTPEGGGGDSVGIKINPNDSDKEGLFVDANMGLGGMSNPSGKGGNAVASAGINFSWVFENDKETAGIKLNAGVNGSYAPPWIDPTAGENAVDLNADNNGGGFSVESGDLSATPYGRLGTDKEVQLGASVGLKDMRPTNVAKGGFPINNHVNSSQANASVVMATGIEAFLNYEKKPGQEPRKHASALKYSEGDMAGPPSPFAANVAVDLGSPTSFGSGGTSMNGGVVTVKGSFSAYLTEVFGIDAALDWIFNLGAGVQKTFGDGADGEPLGKLAFHVSASTQLMPHEHLEFGVGFGAGQTEAAGYDEPWTRWNVGGYAAVPFYFNLGQQATKMAIGVQYVYGSNTTTIDPTAGPGDEQTTGCVLDDGSPDADCDYVADSVDECPNEPGKTEVLPGDETGLGCCEIADTCEPTNDQPAPVVESNNIDDRGMSNWDLLGGTHSGTVFVNWYLNKHWFIGAAGGFQVFQPAMGDVPSTTGGMGELKLGFSFN